jgi:hypothetical protein
VSTTILVNSEAVRFVHEAAQEVGTVDGLEALRLVLEKMHGRPGHITGDTPIAAVVAAFGRDVDHFTLHIYASIAEQERKVISERVRAATLIAKSQGRKVGLQLRSKSSQRRVSALGRAALVQDVNDRAESYRMYIEWAMKQPGREGRLISFRGAAIRLNQRKVETPLGGTWRGHHTQRMARRLRIDHPLARMPETFARDRVRPI